ncbi:TPA: hypothetical protein N0F65_002096 [Lagenidium giganteum]|uniref:Uncharacterized protein n=1 Tax=Lagenidium giganteum TaxID=4803 RepID=A0AAV2ZHJ0_9STRA|nr:TPA: hypothetical protein N0F65_002096 [Lagenidium giganteum]
MRGSALLKHAGEKNAKKLLTDRNAYISFLEVQLERVSAACLASKTFEQRLADLEGAQSDHDQRLASLTKVFRLNQEYVEQTSDQGQQQLTQLTTRVDAWMDKTSTEVVAQQHRLQHVEEQLRHCDDLLQHLAAQSQSEWIDLKAKTERELEDIKALLGGAHAQLEAHEATVVKIMAEQQSLRELVTDKLDQQESIDRAVREMEKSCQADVLRLTSPFEDKLNELNKRIVAQDQKRNEEQRELRNAVDECAELQQALRLHVVAMQHDVTDHKHVLAGQEWSQVQEEIETLRENQHKLKDALRVAQLCMQAAQQTSDDSATALAERLEQAEENFARLTRETLDKCDDLRERVLTALGDVELNLRQDADVVAERAVGFLFLYV